MGKRNKGKFERREQDFYVTPLKAVVPLIPHLRGVKTFAEPCAGNGALAAHLESFGLSCTYAGEIASEEDCRQREALLGIAREYAGIAHGRDALGLTIGDLNGAQNIITNTMWDRKVLHAMIDHFARMAPTWSLQDQDWAVTKQARRFLPMCTDILPIGRVIWIAGTANGGFENCAWYRFDARHSGDGPVLHGYKAPPPSTRMTRWRLRQTLSAIALRRAVLLGSVSTTCLPRAREP